MTDAIGCNNVMCIDFNDDAVRTCFKCGGSIVLHPQQKHILNTAEYNTVLPDGVLTDHLIFLDTMFDDNVGLQEAWNELGKTFDELAGPNQHLRRQVFSYWLTNFGKGLW